jgi:hypothetical protein
MVIACPQRLPSLDPWSSCYGHVSQYMFSLHVLWSVCLWCDDTVCPRQKKLWRWPLVLLLSDHRAQLHVRVCLRGPIPVVHSIIVIIRICCLYSIRISTLLSFEIIISRGCPQNLVSILMVLHLLSTAANGACGQYICMCIWYALPACVISSAILNLQFQQCVRDLVLHCCYILGKCSGIVW